MTESSPAILSLG